MSKQAPVEKRPNVNAEVLGHKVEISSLSFEIGDGATQREDMIVVHFSTIASSSLINEYIFGFDVKIPATSYPTKDVLLKIILTEAESVLAELFEQKKNEKSSNLRHAREESLLEALAEQLWSLLIEDTKHNI